MSDAAENIEPIVDPAPAGDPAPAEPAPAAESRPSIEKFETWEDLESGYKELEAFRGNSVRIPGQEAGDDAWNEFNEKIMQVPGVVKLPAEGDTEGWQNFYQRLGAPGKPEDYQFTPIEGVTDFDDDAGFAQQAHALGLTRQQADGLRQYLAQNVIQSTNEAAEAQQAGISELQQTWGKAFDHNVKLATAAAKQLDSELPGVAEYMENTPVEQMDANTVKMLNLFANMMGETGAIDVQRADGIMTPEEAMLQAQEMRDNPDHPYNNELDPAHQAAQKKMTDLYKIAYSK